MEQYSREFLERNQPPFNLRFTIQKLIVSYNKLIAIAEVFQEASRYQDLAGKRRKVETSVVQREIWAKTPDGWKLKSVDNVRDQKKSVDGKRVDPAKPYDPDDPPYNPVSYAHKQNLSEAEAVKLAEQFIAQNGYTDLPPEKDKLAYETIEWESNEDEMLKERHDTLTRKAYGILRGRKTGPDGWTVVFRYKHHSGRENRRTGRAVTMNLDGSDARVEHVDFILRSVEKRL